MKSNAIHQLSPIIIHILIITHTTVHGLWLPPLLFEEQHTAKNVHKKESSETTLIVDAANIGKTHFLVGADTNSVPHQSHKKSEKLPHPIPSVKPGHIDGIPLNSDGRVCAVLFDKFYETLTTLIEREQKKISLAAYMLTDKRIAHLLKEAHDRGVNVELVTDLSCLRERSNKLGDLYEGDIPIFICMPERKGAKSSLMHNKFILFEKNIYDRNIVWTGSANMTRSALTEIHHENVVILDDRSVYQAYEKEFAYLKKQSERYEDCTITNAALHEKIRTSENNKKNTQARAKTHAIA